MDAQQVLQRLADAEAEERRNLADAADQYNGTLFQQEEVELDSDAPIYQQYLSEGGANSIRNMTNFTDSEFDTLWNLIEDEMQSSWRSGRGRRPKTEPKDAFFMTLTVLKHYQNWDKHALDFGLVTSTFEKLVSRVIRLVSPLFSNRFIKAISMSEQRRTRTFENFPFALYATDVKFQVSNRPAGKFMEQKHYFSGKHKLYGYKIECSVSPSGQVVHLSSHYPVRRPISVFSRKESNITGRCSPRHLQRKQSQITEKVRMCFVISGQCYATKVTREQDRVFELSNQRNNRAGEVSRTRRPTLMQEYRRIEFWWRIFSAACQCYGRWLTQHTGGARKHTIP
jgi:hypothetical protein